CFGPGLLPIFASITALADFDFRSPSATLTWLNPSSLPQLRSMRLFLSFIERLLSKPLHRLSSNDAKIFQIWIVAPIHTALRSCRSEVLAKKRISSHGFKPLFDAKLLADHCSSGF